MPSGLPLQSRGLFGFDASLFSAVSGSTSAAGIDLVASVPLLGRTLLDATVALGIDDAAFSLGNPGVGAHNVLRIKRRMWLTVGGALFLPIATSRSSEALAGTIPRALWNLHELTPETFSFLTRLAFEAHGDSFEMRLGVDPVFLFPIGGRTDVEYVLQHALEVQYGHGFGAGIRLQGVAVPTDKLDGYQSALEPFFAVEQTLAMLRLGLMLPLDRRLGPPFSDGGAWGAHITAGIRLDGPAARRPWPEPEPAAGSREAQATSIGESSNLPDPIPSSVALPVPSPKGSDSPAP